MLRVGVVALLLGSVFAAAATETHRRHGPHVHGEAKLDIGVDGQMLVVGLDAPGMSLLGFERAPRDDAERVRYERALDLLRHPDRWLSLPPEAGCVLDGSEVAPHGFANEKDDASAQHHEHADFDASYQYRCHVPLALRTIEVGLIAQFPDLHRITVDLVLPDRQGSQVLSPGSNTIVLTK